MLNKTVLFVFHTHSGYPLKAKTPDEPVSSGGFKGTQILTDSVFMYKGIENSQTSLRRCHASW